MTFPRGTRAEVAPYRDGPDMAGEVVYEADALTGILVVVRYDPPGGTDVQCLTDDDRAWSHRESNERDELGRFEVWVPRRRLFRTVQPT